ncbi:rhomboid family intramembrane serine protease [Neorhizobium galegae]|uniref:rhomboid family intramembrane serine protease n=1 Tax=Neorhizobium galegae TaxID=399 RepID=UPI00062227A8|nr:rhomboid family intramembrane serine protease [Neorhizobium galegae]CDZ27022.1 Rhomboid family protein [Neorhizobium galegae bv. officinalis]KAA9388722.1 rhomboid family intramembrane serine protease [Neorhizobium galegae]KAB1116422.1 rhomboid family intramembrane serine protease [Neorhizobium galegae]MCM2498095.1 rhomboid family intramembrane serine protease [Neorhizobium galegae]MCQ1768712.1 rhomboid family intramembrane serine protease [Neorhizobium galegae]
MFIPLHDAVELKYIRVQYVTISIIAINVLVWLFTNFSAPNVAERASLGLGFIPAVIFNYATLDPSLVIVPDDFTFVTYAFLHMDFWHLASNMLFLWVFGDNVEDALGHVKFLAFYLLCAAAGAAFHGFVASSSEGPLIGASGAVSGVVAAYFLLHPRVRVWVLVLFRIPLPLPAFIPLALWIVQQFAMLALDLDGMVSWGAHVGGIIAGAILVLFMRRRGVPLFDRNIVTPKAVELKPDVRRIGAATE